MLNIVIVRPMTVDEQRAFAVNQLHELQALRDYWRASGGPRDALDDAIDADIAGIESEIQEMDAANAAKP